MYDINIYTIYIYEIYYSCLSIYINYIIQCTRYIAVPIKINKVYQTLPIYKYDTL